MNPADLASWHDFFVVIGAAAGALIGSLFVVASLGVGFLTPERATGMRVFLTPVIAHVAGVLIACAVLLIPTLDLRTIGAMLGVASLGGLSYSSLIAVRAWEHEIDRADRFWYAAMPVIGYGIMAGAAVLTWAGRWAGLDVLAGAISLLLIGAIRNAWDMVLFLVTRERPN